MTISRWKSDQGCLLSSPSHSALFTRVIVSRTSQSRTLFPEIEATRNYSAAGSTIITFIGFYGVRGGRSRSKRIGADDGCGIMETDGRAEMKG